MAALVLMTDALSQKIMHASTALLQLSKHRHAGEKLGIVGRAKLMGLYLATRVYYTSVLAIVARYPQDVHKCLKPECSNLQYTGPKNSFETSRCHSVCPSSHMYNPQCAPT